MIQVVEVEKLVIGSPKRLNLGNVEGGMDSHSVGQLEANCHWVYNPFYDERANKYRGPISRTPPSEVGPGSRATPSDPPGKWGLENNGD